MKGCMVGSEAQYRGLRRRPQRWREVDSERNASKKVNSTCVEMRQSGYNLSSSAARTRLLFPIPPYITTYLSID